MPQKKINKAALPTDGELLLLRENNLSNRLKLILCAETIEKGRFPFLESNSGISAATWRTWWTRGGAPNGVLLEAVAKLWPHFSYWLLTGRTDVRCGHDMPKLHASAQGYISNWPEEGSLRIKINNSYSREYFKATLAVDGAESSQEDHVKSEIKFEVLKLTAKKRLSEITKNFDTNLVFEESY
jgi:hypothetical protein